MMVLGLNAKSRRGPTVQVEYQIHIQEIKPWPPTQSLRSLRSVLIQWENGERNSGSTATVVPSIGSVVGEGKIEFNESFKLPVTLVKEVSAKGRDGDAFQKNSLEFGLYERRRDKNQLLATAIVDLADHGILKEALSTSVSMNCKRTITNASQPVLFFRIQPIDKSRNGSLKGRPSKVASLERSGSGSVSDLMSEEYAEEAELASFTDDDVSSHSSMTVTSSAMESSRQRLARSDENGANTLTDNKGEVKMEQASASNAQLEKSEMKKQITESEDAKQSSSRSSSVDFSSDIESQVDGRVSISNSHDPTSNGLSHNASSLAGENTEEETKSSVNSNGSENLNQEVHKLVFSAGKAVNGYIEEKASVSVAHGDREGNNRHENDNVEDQLSNISSQHTLSFDQENLGTNVNAVKGDRLKHVKSVRSSSDVVRGVGSLNTNYHGETGAVEPLKGNERKDAKVYPKDTRGVILNNKVQQLEQKIKMLEGELREAAAIEAALYSVVADHGSSVSKVHAPARRLSRLYLHSCREGLRSRKASAARSSVSGLLLVAKACGNDVPRLTFWLSNSVVLRSIISQSTVESGSGFSSRFEKSGGGKRNKQASSSLNWKDATSYIKSNGKPSFENFGDWGDPNTFIFALERVEAWIFSRIIESVWWQTLTPHMQSAAMKSTDKGAASDLKKNYGRKSSLCNQDQVNFSLDHWKNAFKDACERLCPVRAEGHECGCLPVLARLIMEQCVARLDVAMFNAILRESDDEIPTDPVSDPISDSSVLPIPAGITSFGAGAQLKNAIGNWSRWLTDLFGIDDDDAPEDENDSCYSDEQQDPSSKSFYLLNALSDLMMLPKDMLLNASIRKEVCPTFGAPLIKRVLDYFVPDEFCPDPVPNDVLEALDIEDPEEASEESVTNFPCSAAPPAYSPPSASFVASIIGEVGKQPQLRKSGSAVLRKSNTSDDELEELSSPWSSIFNDGFRSSSVSSKPNWKTKGDGTQNAIRYQLLRDVWSEEL